MITAVFEDTDWRRPIFALMRDGLVFVVLPTIYLVLLTWGEDPLMWPWLILMAWSLGAMGDGFLRWREIATADSVSRVEVQVEQVTSRVLQVRVSASAFRRIKRVGVELLSKPELLDVRPRQVDRRRVMPGGGRRSVSATMHLSVPDRATCGADAWLTTGLVLRLITSVEGCPDLVHDLPIPWAPDPVVRERRECG